MLDCSFCCVCSRGTGRMMPRLARRAFDWPYLVMLTSHVDLENQIKLLFFEASLLFSLMIRLKHSIFGGNMGMKVKASQR